MELLLQDSSWSCLPTAFAICLDCLPKEIYDFLGHDGSDILWPDLPDPFKRRGFLMEEMIDYSIQRELTAPVTFYTELTCEPERKVLPNGETYQPFDPMQRIADYLHLVDGVLLTMPKGKSTPHAVAWNKEEEKVYDPSGFKADIDEYEIFYFVGLFG